MSKFNYKFTYHDVIYEEVGFVGAPYSMSDMMDKFTGSDSATTASDTVTGGTDGGFGGIMGGEGSGTGGTDGGYGGMGGGAGSGMGGGYVGGMGSGLDISSIQGIKILSLRNLGGVDLSNSKSIYPIDYTAKDRVVEYLDAWNAEGDIKFGD